MSEELVYPHCKVCEREYQYCPKVPKSEAPSSICGWCLARLWGLVPSIFD